MSAAENLVPTVVDPSWFSEVPRDREWLLKDSRANGRGVLPAGKVGGLIAAGGIGKTMVLTQLALAVAGGFRWLDTFDVTPGRVLLVLGEEDEEEARRRTYHAGKVGGLEEEGLKGMGYQA